MIGQREEAAEAFLSAALERSELANVWAAILSLCLAIACIVAIGVWLVRYHQEAEDLRDYILEPTSAVQLIWDDFGLP